MYLTNLIRLGPPPSALPLHQSKIHQLQLNFNSQSFSSSHTIYSKTCLTPTDSFKGLSPMSSDPNSLLYPALHSLLLINDVRTMTKSSTTMRTRERSLSWPSELLIRQTDHQSPQISRNAGSFPKTDLDVGTGLVGAPACGDVMKLQIKVDSKGVISDVRCKCDFPFSLLGCKVHNLIQPLVSLSSRSSVRQHLHS